MDLDFENKDGGCILNIGKTRSGKSNACKYMILKNSHIFNFGIVFVSTKFNNSYDYIPDEYVFENYDEGVLKNYIKKLEDWRVEHKKPPPKNFIIFDDMVGLLNSRDAFLNHLHTVARHTSTFIFHNIQYIKAISPTIRENIEYVLMFNSKTKNTLNALYENFGQDFDTYQEFKNHILQWTQPYTAILYRQDQEEMEDNFTQFKAPDMSNVNIKLQY